MKIFYFPIFQIKTMHLYLFILILDTVTFAQFIMEKQVNLMKTYFWFSDKWLFFTDKTRIFNHVDLLKFTIEFLNELKHCVFCEHFFKANLFISETNLV